ncbi:MAG: farnesyl diphosphate synthase [Steroidobacteraceae bacterium]
MARPADLRTLTPAIVDAVSFRACAAAAQRRIAAALERTLNLPDAAVQHLQAAMSYSVLAGGKRLRPLLVYVTGEALGARPEQLDAPAVAVELIHTYSLIHDDLPAMDNDDLRRGLPTCHKAFDEGTAILAGDALQALAFDILASSADLSDSARLQMIVVLSAAIGTQGMAGGQAMDLAAAGTQLTAASIEAMHRRKTGALIRASVELGAIAAGLVASAERAALRRYGEEIGLAFQIQDDILDVTGQTAVLGKRAGADAANDKPTYPSVFGLARAQELACLHRDRALAELAGMGAAAGTLRALAYAVVERVS